MAKITSIDIIKGVSVVDTSPFVLRSGIEERTENQRRIIGE